MSAIEGTFRMRLHEVEPVHGQHHAFYVDRLGELSLAALEWQGPIRDPNAGTEGATYATIHDVPNLAWVELEDNRPLSQPATADETFLVTGAQPYTFVSAADILKEGVVPDHSIKWLRSLMVADRPVPPYPRAQTRVLREITTLLPPLDAATYRAVAVAAMPHLAEYYKQWDKGIRPDDMSYTLITNDILVQQEAASSSKQWLEHSGVAHSAKEILVFQTKSERRIKMVLPYLLELDRTSLESTERSRLEAQWRLREQARQRDMKTLKASEASSNP